VLGQCRGAVDLGDGDWGMLWFAGLLRQSEADRQMVCGGFLPCCCAYRHGGCMVPCLNVSVGYFGNLGQIILTPK
jgi:hypothetical protein